MNELSDYNRFLIALSLIPRIGRKKIDSIISILPPLVVPSCSFLQNYLSSMQFALISAFLSGVGELYAEILKIELQLKRQNIYMINQCDVAYPYLLKQIPDPPIYLFYKGDVDVLSSKQIAIVGSRNASSSGLRHAYSFAGQLTQAGFVVTSGLAQGVDGASHAGALDAGGLSVAVMGAGLSSVYPRSNEALAHRILDSGCWVSEYLPGCAPVAANFPRRNRIISGLSLGVLVVEARLKSGTLITARTALEQNREVFAMPGPIDYPGSVGCHRLISEGAKLVQNVDDIVSEFVAAHAFIETQAESIPLEPALQGLLELIDFGSMSLVELANMSGLYELDLLSMLVDLELQGLIENDGVSIRRII